MPITHITGDLLEATTEYIVQQTCCTALRAHGLSETIAKRWPTVNPYAERRVYRGNWSVPADRPEPGSITLYEFESPLSSGLRGVICAFGQYCHGRPGKYSDPLGLDKGIDTPAHREKYFELCLEAIATLEPKSVGIPYRIGSGLAGGDWDIYYGMIQRWSESHPEIEVVIYKFM